MNTKNSFRTMKSVLLLAAVLSGVSATSAWATPIILNNSFENPDAGSPSGNYHEGVPPTSSTEVGTGGGYIGNGSAYGNTSSPDGTQVLLLKSAGGVSQVLSGFQPFKFYEISFYSEGRSGSGAGGGPDTFNVLINGTPMKFSGNPIVTPGQGSYSLFTSDPLFITTATPTLAFVGLASTDLSSFVDLVTATQVAPEPSSFLLCGLGAIGLLLAARRRRRQA